MKNVLRNEIEVIALAKPQPQSKWVLAAGRRKLSAGTWQVCSLLAAPTWRMRNNILQLPTYFA